MLGLNLLFFYYFKLIGLGISFLIGYVLYFIQVYYIANKSYNFNISEINANKYFTIILFSTVTLILMKFIPTPYNMVISTLIFLYSIFFSYQFFRKV